jgi:hypothetical protein
MKRVNFSCEKNHYWVWVCQYDEAEQCIRLVRDSRLCPLCGAQGRIESIERYEFESLRGGPTRRVRLARPLHGRPSARSP